MPENFSVFLTFIAISLVFGLAVGYLLARVISSRKVKRLEKQLTTIATEARGDLTLQFGTELEKIRNDLLGVARSYDGALRVLRNNLPADFDLQHGSLESSALPRELEFKSEYSDSLHEHHGQQLEAGDSK